MLSELFPRTHRRYEESPVAGELEQVAAWFLEVGYSRDNTRDHLFRLRTVLERIGGLPLNAVFTEARLQEAFTSDRWQALYRGTQRAFARFLCTRDRLLLSQATIRFSTLRANYHDYLTDLRGFPCVPI